MKKLSGIIFAVLIVLSAGLFLLRCDIAGSDSTSDDGGAGADVDLSNYYTIAQTDSAISDAVSNAIAGLTKLQVIGDPVTKTISATGSGNGVTYSSVPSQTSQAFINVHATNLSGSAQTLRIIASPPSLSNSDPILTITLQNGEEINLTCHVNVFFSSTDWLIWNNGDALDVDVAPKIWITN